MAVMSWNPEYADVELMATSGMELVGGSKISSECGQEWKLSQSSLHWKTTLTRTNYPLIMTLRLAILMIAFPVAAGSRAHHEEHLE